MAKLQLVFVPTPLVGHLISTIEFAKALLSSSRGRFCVTVLMIPHQSSSNLSYIESVVSSGLDIHFEVLPQADAPPSKNQRVEVSISKLIEAHKPQVKDSISRHLYSVWSAPIAGLVLDLFSTSMIEVADEFSIPAYIYFTSNAASLVTMLYLPTYFNGKIMDAQGNIYIPGLQPAPLEALPMLNIDKNEACMTMAEHGFRFRGAKGIIVNTFTELEQMPLLALAAGQCLPDDPTPQIFPVGPMLSVVSEKDSHVRHECLDWLDAQPLTSVVFLCFGSMGSFEASQVKEMASGMERSGQRFLWALRSPSTTGGLPTDSKLDEILPEGFLERTKSRGLVWPTWAPQAEILAHQAVGGFVSHCGWNSSLESLWFGVPMLGWPLYAEQHLNCLQLVKDSGVALELKLDYKNGGFVSSEELENGVRILMGESEEGKKVRAKAKEMRLAGRRATEEGGSSCTALQCLIGDFTENQRVTDDKREYYYMTPAIIAT